MAFMNRNLSVIAFANGWTMWHYVSAEDKTEKICADGYFNSVSNLCHTGDMFIINGADNGTVIRVVLKDGKEVTLTKPKD